MLFDLPALVAKHGMRIDGVIHAGAHLAEEAAAYAEVGVEEVWWIEGNPELQDDLEGAVHEAFAAHPRVKHHIVMALLGERDGDELTLHASYPYTGSSSILAPAAHLRVSPDVKFRRGATVATRTLDSLAAQTGMRGNFLNMDLQGAELIALRGGEEILRSVDYVYTEINEDELYRGCVLLPDLVQHLGERGFAMVELQPAGDPKRGMRNWVGWGDAIFVRT